MTDILTKEKRSWNMSRIKGKDTKPEITLRSLLHRAGLRFRLHEKKLPGRPDIVLPKYKTAIFVNGCFWHRHENCKYAYMPKTRLEFWKEKFEQTVHRDMENNRALIADGWYVFTAWECELKEAPGKVVDRILELLGGEGNG